MENLPKGPEGNLSKTPLTISDAQMEGLKKNGIKIKSSGNNGNAKENTPEEEAVSIEKDSTLGNTEEPLFSIEDFSEVDPYAEEKKQAAEYRFETKEQKMNKESSFGQWVSTFGKFIGKKVSFNEEKEEEPTSTYEEWLKKSPKYESKDKKDSFFGFEKILGAKSEELWGKLSQKAKNSLDEIYEDTGLGEVVDKFKMANSEFWEDSFKAKIYNTKNDLTDLDSKIDKINKSEIEIKSKIKELDEENVSDTVEGAKALQSKLKLNFESQLDDIDKQKIRLFNKRNTKNSELEDAEARKDLHKSNKDRIADNFIYGFEKALIPLEKEWKKLQSKLDDLEKLSKGAKLSYEKIDKELDRLENEKIELEKLEKSLRDSGVSTGKTKASIEEIERVLSENKDKVRGEKDSLEKQKIQIKRDIADIMKDIRPLQNKIKGMNFMKNGLSDKSKEEEEALRFFGRLEDAMPEEIFEADKEELKKTEKSAAVEARDLPFDSYMPASEPQAEKIVNKTEKNKETKKPKIDVLEFLIEKISADKKPLLTEAQNPGLSKEEFFKKVDSLNPKKGMFRIGGEKNWGPIRSGEEILKIQISSKRSLLAQYSKEYKTYVFEGSEFR